MYHYIYDAALQDKRHRLSLTTIENRLTDLGIQGRIDRLSLFKNVRESVAGAVRRGTSTVVVVGNDLTFHKVLDVIPEFPVVLGIIPMGKPNRMARLLGIPIGIAACDVLSARRTHTLDIGRVNGHHFLAALSIINQRVTMDCEGRFRVTSLRGGSVHICNITPFSKTLDKDGADLEHYADPSDGILEAIITPRQRIWSSGSKRTVLNLRKITVSAPKSFPFFADGHKLSGAKAEVDVLPARLRVIVGKNRLFRVKEEI